MFRVRKPRISIIIPSGAFEAIFDECDRFDVDETGGRLIGCYREKGNQYDIEVSGVIGPGPSARRTATSFYQDGEYQEEVFRSIEKTHPEIEHLGNWHTHHVNGFPTLSSGDIATYQKIVNHNKHNTDFFYAILVVEKISDRCQRYKVKHYFLRRNDPTVYEIPEKHVHVVDKPIVWPAAKSRRPQPVMPMHSSDVKSKANYERVKDQEFFSEFYPHFRPLFSKSAGALYWKGKLELIDGTSVDILALENHANGGLSYSIATVTPRSPTLSVLDDCKDQVFKSARGAVLFVERSINKEIYLKKGSNS